MQPLCPLCLCGNYFEAATTEAQRTQRLHRDESNSENWLTRKEALGRAKLLDDELADIHSRGDTGWFETTAIDQLASTAEGARWLKSHARKESLKELNDGAYKIRFIQVLAKPKMLD